MIQLDSITAMMEDDEDRNERKSSKKKSNKKSHKKSHKKKHDKNKSEKLKQPFQSRESLIAYYSQSNDGNRNQRKHGEYDSKVTIRDTDAEFWNQSATKYTNESSEESDGEGAVVCTDVVMDASTIPEALGRTISPPRRSRARSSSESSRSMSPPRRGRVRSSSSSSSANHSRSPPRRARLRSSSPSESSDRDLSPPRRRRRVDSSDESSDETRGNNTNVTQSDTVYRDKSGRIVDIKKDLQEDKRNVERERAEAKVVEYEWGMGATEKDKNQQNRLRLEEARNEDLAIYADDQKLNDFQKNIIRDGDPMASSVSKLQNSNSSSTSSSKKMYRGPPAAPNRFGILPGYRWDGTDRSNGFEKRYLASISIRDHQRERMSRISAQDL